MKAKNTLNYVDGAGSACPLPKCSVRVHCQRESGACPLPKCSCLGRHGVGIVKCEVGRGIVK
jgi:hypothetical protein